MLKKIFPSIGDILKFECTCGIAAWLANVCEIHTDLQETAFAVIPSSDISEYGKPKWGNVEQLQHSIPLCKKWKSKCAELQFIPFAICYVTCNNNNSVPSESTLKYQ